VILHHHCCEIDEHALCGEAVTDCRQDWAGRYWVDNGEYASCVSYCPFCGRKAPLPPPESLTKDEQDRVTAWLSGDHETPYQPDRYGDEPEAK
jgi:hypothetical protein